MYSVCMTRLNVYVPDELSERAKAAGLNISALTQHAIARELDRTAGEQWLADLPAGHSRVTHTMAMDALDAARDEDELEDRG